MMRYVGAAVIIVLAVIMLFPLIKIAGRHLFGWFKEAEAEADAGVAKDDASVRDKFRRGKP